MNLQIIAGPDGRLVGVSGPLPGSCHDLNAAWIWGIIREPAKTGLIVLAENGCQGAGPHILTSYKGKNKPEPKRQANCSHARFGGPGERANARLKTWKVLAKLRCCPHRAGHLAKAILILHERETTGCAKRLDLWVRRLFIHGRRGR